MDAHEMRRQHGWLLDCVRAHGTATDDQLRIMTRHVPTNNGIERARSRIGLALPPAAVQGAYWWLHTTSKGQLAVSPLRIAGSYQHADALHAQFAPPISQPPLIREALVYANHRWGPYLFADTYPSAAKITLVGPDNKPVRTMYAWLRTRTQTILTGPAHLRTDALNVAYIYLTADPINGLERCGSNPERIQYCARCGHYRSGQNCPGCNMHFAPYPAAPREVPIPMSARVIQGFREDLMHRFAVDPNRWLDR